MCTMAIRIKKCRLENNLTQEELAENRGNGSHIRLYTILLNGLG